MVSLSAKIVVICLLINIVLAAKTGHYEQDPQVSHFFGITEKVLDKDNDSRRRERLLGQQIGSSIAELVEIIVQSFNSLAEMMPLQKITNIDFEANPKLVKTASTVLSGMSYVLSLLNFSDKITNIFQGILLAVFWPSTAMFGTMVYYVLAASSSLLTIIHR